MFASGLARSIPLKAGIIAMEVDMGIADLPRPIGYVLGGGGSLGAVQVGMLQALSEHDIAPGVVAGTSVGSLNGAVVALDPASTANRLSHLWARLTREMVFPGGLLAQLGPRRLYDGGLVANVPMRQALAMGARSLVVLDCNFPGHAPGPPETIAEVLFYTALVTMRTQPVLKAARSFLGGLDVTGPGLYGSP